MPPSVTLSVMVEAEVSSIASRPRPIRAPGYERYVGTWRCEGALPTLRKDTYGALPPLFEPAPVLPLERGVEIECRASVHVRGNAYVHVGNARHSVHANVASAGVD
jgi:hypothetical protein